MQLSEKQVKEFRSIYQKKFGIDLTKEAAYEEGVKVLQLFKAIYKPIKKGETNETRKKNIND